MIKINEEEFPINGKYIVGVSGGPDSMCLLFTLINQKYDIIVCNVNYNTRDVSSMEQEMVGEYCKKYSIPFETISVSHSKKNKNFEGWAREVRYNFFSEVYKKYHADGLFIAHHKNDDLETYILQKNRNNIVRRWGLSLKTRILGMNVYRPFLAYSKVELVNECDKNSIPYSIDITNLKPVCERNKVRIDLIYKYSKEQIDELFLQKDRDNEKLLKQMEKIIPLRKKNEWEVKEIENLSEIERIRFIYEIIVAKIPSLANKLSRKRIEEYLKLLFSNKVNVCIKIIDNYEIWKSFGYIKFVIVDDNKEYLYTLEKPGKLDTKYFSFEMPEDASFLKITNESYPLIIRNVRMNDVVSFGNVKKKMNRIMIDEKIPLFKRKNYPIILDKNQNVKYFPLYKSDKQKNIANKLKFVIK